jgi:hypothetical protein
MAEHRILIGLFGESNTVAGAQCSRCSQIVLLENGKIPDDILQQECPAKREDFRQPAAPVARQAAARD